MKYKKRPAATAAQTTPAQPYKTPQHDIYLTKLAMQHRHEIWLDEKSQETGKTKEQLRAEHFAEYSEPLKAVMARAALNRDSEVWID
jgi:hypothetical protein